MTSTTRLMIGMTAAAAGTMGGLWVWSWIKRWRRKDPAELERLRRLEVNRIGRISAGRILDVVESPAGSSQALLVVYEYEAGGVTYQAAQDVTLLPDIAAVAGHLPGLIVSVKYDPRTPTNSIIACEQWSGIMEAPGERAVAEPQKDKSVLAQ